MAVLPTMDALLKHAIYDCFPEPIAILDPALALRYFNKAWCEAFERVQGYPPSLGLPFSDYVCEEAREEGDAGNARALGGEYTIREILIPQLNEPSSWRECHFIPIFGSSGEVAGILHFTRCVKAQRLREDELHEREARMTAILDSSANGIVTIDEDGNIDMVNAAAETMFGYSPQELLGQNVKILIPTRREEHDGYLRRYKPTGERRVIGCGREVDGLRKDGSVFPISMGLSESWIGQKRYFTAILQDITERRDLERRIRRAEKMEAVGQLAGGVAHDFNNLLTVVDTYAHRLEDGLKDGSERLEYIRKIRGAVERGGRLAHQLLSISPDQVGDPTSVRLNEMILKLEQLLRRVIEADVHIENILEPNLRLIEIDPGHLEQVLMNLVINARDAMPEGGRICIRTFNAHVNPDEESGQHPAELVPGDYVVFQVKDHGHGIGPEVLDRIFEPFFTTKAQGKGTGLGLPTVYGIVQRYGGAVDVTSSVGQGATFTVYFPVLGGEVHEAAPELKMTIESPHKSRTHTILVVDDEDDLRAGLRVSLVRDGFHVLDAASGEDALRLAARYEGEIDLLLTDVVMPGITGLELSDQLHDIYPNIRSLFVSGHSGDVLQGRSIGPQHVRIAKPYNIAQLKAVVREILD